MTGHPPRDEPPRRKVITTWGELEAACIHPYRVSFSTARAMPTQSSHLIINRVRYIFSVTVRRSEVPLDRRHRVGFLDQRWHLDPVDNWSLYRQGRSDSTEGARAVVRQRVMPELVKWLNGDDAARLLADGAAYWRADCQDQAVRTEQQLLAAVDRLRALRDRVTGGHVLTDQEERYLRSLRLEVP